MKKYIFMLAGLILAFTLGLVFFSLYQTPKIEKELAKLSPLATIPRRAESRVTRQQPLSHLTPAKPEDYGIMIIEVTNQAQTQEEWDRIIHQKMQKLRPQGSPEAKARTKAEVETREEQIGLIDKSIQQQEELLKQDSANQELKERLQRSMILRSITKESLQ
jgi:hypothetical protein